MAVTLSPLGGAAAQFFNNSGTPLNGGFIYTYQAGTTTPQATYTTSSGNIQSANPIQLDSSGRVPGGEIWLTFGSSYKFVIQDSNNVLIGTYDNIAGFYGNNIQDYTGDGTTTAFNLPSSSSGVYNVFINGVYQNKNTYSISSGQIIFSEAPPLTSVIEIEV